MTVNEELFNAFEALTFDDVLVVPGYTRCCPIKPTRGRK